MSVDWLKLLSSISRLGIARTCVRLCTRLNEMVGCTTGGALRPHDATNESGTEPAHRTAMRSQPAGAGTPVVRTGSAARASGKSEATIRLTNFSESCDEAVYNAISVL